MSNTLFIFTNSFPYGIGETFIDNEMPFWDVFDKIVIMTTDRGLPIRQHNLPKKTEVITVTSMRGMRAVINSLKVFFRKEFYTDFANINIGGKLGLRRLIHLIGFSARGLYLASIIERLVEKEMSKGSNVFLYSYWLNEWAYGAAIISQKHGITAISRAHGYDLYSERNELNYLPQRNYLQCKLSCIYPISKNGTDYLCSRLGQEDKISLSRLGTFDCGESPAPCDNTHIRIVSCSWMSPVKRIERIIEALHLVKNHDVEWIHIGDGVMADEIKKRARALPVNIKAVFKGSMTTEEIYEFYRNTQIHYFVNVSESEGIPVSIMEATSMGIPVIATNVGGTSEIVKDGFNGYLLDDHFDPHQLADKIDKNVDNNDLRQNARSFWDNNYNAAKNYPSFFENILTLEKTNATEM